jgi:hypothetical protein
VIAAAGFLLIARRRRSLFHDDEEIACDDARHCERSEAIQRDIDLDCFVTLWTPRNDRAEPIGQ